MQPQIRPAEPLLASQVLSDAELGNILEDVLSGHNGESKRDRETGLLGTGCKNVDDALEGGIEEGRVVSVSAEIGDGGEICRALLVTSLFKYPASTAAVIDTTGNFDVVRLYSLILVHLQRDRDAVAAERAALGKEKELQQKQDEAENVAAEMLNRVKIMRAFDFVGVREAIGEVRDELEGRTFVVAQEKKVPDVLAEQAVTTPPPPANEPRRRTFVADSEDEEDDENDEMLFETTTSTSEVQPSNSSPLPAIPPAKQTHAPLQQEAQTTPNPSLKFILLDTLAHVLTPLVKKDSIPAHALASTFLTSLTHLTRTHKLHTILLNPLTPPRAHAQQPPPALPSAPPQLHTHALPSTSLFASSTAVPALGGVLSRYVDTGLLVERVPRGKADARMFYGEEFGGGGGKGKRGVKMAVVVEVVGEREGGRNGAWGVWEGV